MSDLESSSNVYVCPENFEEESLPRSQLYYEDLDDDAELWLVRMPVGTEPNTFEDTVISLDGNENILNQVDSNKLFQCVALSDAPDLHLILPEKETGELKTVQQNFKGTILMTEEDPTFRTHVISTEHNQDPADENGPTNEVHTKKKKHKKQKK